MSFNLITIIVIKNMLPKLFALKVPNLILLYQKVPKKNVE